MPTSRVTARKWIAGFEAAREVERAARRTVDVAQTALIALQLSDAALAARAPEMKAQRDAEDERVRETWRRLRQRHAR